MFATVYGPSSAEFAAQTLAAADVAAMRLHVSQSATSQSAPTIVVRARAKHLYTTNSAKAGAETPWRDFSKKGLRTHHLEQLRVLAAHGPCRGRDICSMVKAGVKHMPELVSLGLITAEGSPLIYQITQAGMEYLQANASNVA